LPFIVHTNRVIIALPAVTYPRSKFFQLRPTCRGTLQVPLNQIEFAARELILYAQVPPAELFVGVAKLH
jgi:hypothetical protein